MSAIIERRPRPHISTSTFTGPDGLLYAESRADLGPELAEHVTLVCGGERWRVFHQPAAYGRLAYWHAHRELPGGGVDLECGVGVHRDVRTFAELVRRVEASGKVAA